MLYNKIVHVFFSGIGGTGIGPLALIAKQAGFVVSGSDKQDSAYIHYLRDQGITNIHIGQSGQAIEDVHTSKPIEWYVYSAAVAIEQPDAPEFAFCRSQGIRLSQRDELINLILEEKQLKLIAVAGTHGKTTTTAMLIWLFKQFNIPVSYSVGAKIPFGDMGQYRPGSQYFIYEADEYARNFLAFDPVLSVITGVDWDHPDIYPTRESYNAAFKQFLGQSERIVAWQEDAALLQLLPNRQRLILNNQEPAIAQFIRLPGLVNRLDAWEAIQAMAFLFGDAKMTSPQTSTTLIDQSVQIINTFPGVSRRFEKLTPTPQRRLYSDYAHTPPKIRGALGIASEVGGQNIVVVYEGLHNSRQHFIKEDLEHLFDEVKKLYIVPSYMARENPDLEVLTPEKLSLLLSPIAKAKCKPSELNTELKQAINDHLEAGDLVLCLTAGGGGSLDEWLRLEFRP